MLSGQESVVGGDDAVAGEHACASAGAAGSGLNDIDSVLEEVELDADAEKFAFEWLVEFASLFSGGKFGVGVEGGKHGDDCLVGD